MKIIKLTSKVADVILSSMRPAFRYELKKKGQVIEVPEAHAKKLLQNPDLFKEVGKKEKEEPIKKIPSGDTQ